MKTLFLLFVGALLGIAALPYIVFRQKDLPPGTNLASPSYRFENASLLVDRTAWNAREGEHELEHEIFDSILTEIHFARTFIIADFFLWNPWKGDIGSGLRFRPLAEELAKALIAKRQQDPDLPILVITDPINRVYGDLNPRLYDELTDAGIPVIFTDLSKLPDSNMVYAPQAHFWKGLLGGPSDDPADRWMKNPFNPDGKDLTNAQIARLLFFKANHRKLLITGRGTERARILMPSLNPADGSANHSNLGLLVDGPVARFAARSELEIALWSSEDTTNVHGGLVNEAAQTIQKIERIVRDLPKGDSADLSEPSVAYRSERAIRDEILLQFQKAISGTHIDIGLFYFSDRKVVEGLIAAIERGAVVRVLLDANRDAFGREKNGIPNRTVAAELMELAALHDVEVRWAVTNGEQFHGKFVRVSGPQQEVLLLGSANWTRRNLDNLNLEANLLLNNATAINRKFDTYFSSIWSNRRGVEESLPYEAWAETGWTLRWKTWLYRFQEWSGASTF